MIIRKTYKYRIYLKKSQVTNLENQFSMCRHLYNWSLAERMDAYKNENRSISYNEQQNALPSLKKDRPWYKGVHSQVLQDTLKRLDKAYKAFFRRVKKGETPGFPKFKKRGQWNSLTYPQHVMHPDSYIKVPKLGNVKVVLHRTVPKDAKVKTLNISKEAGKWFACFSVEEEICPHESKQALSPLGLDLGLIDLYYSSDGQHSPAPKYYRKKQKHLTRLQQRLAKTSKSSPKWKKILRSVQKAHYRIACMRKDFLHKEANKVLGKSSLIVHEDLKICNMIRRPKPKQDVDGKYLPNGACWKSGMNKSIADIGWRMFLDFVGYKATWQRKNVIAVPPHYTSQTCPDCGDIVKKSLSTRTHACPCGCRMHRDHAAAINILRIGLNTLADKAA